MRLRNFVVKATLIFLAFVLVYAYAAFTNDEQLVMLVGGTAGILVAGGLVLLFVGAAWKFFDASKDLIKATVEHGVSRRPPL